MKALVMQLTLLSAVLGLCTAQARQSARQHTSEAVPSGEELYKSHCAVCHGNDLKGNGPAPAPFLQETPDLTTLAQRHKEFPDAYIANVLRSGVKIPAHGPAEMPMWGATFRESEQLNESQISQRIANLVSYIKLHQQK